MFPRRSPLGVPLWVCRIAPMVLDTQLHPSHFGQAWRPAAVLDTEHQQWRSSRPQMECVALWNLECH